MKRTAFVSHADCSRHDTGWKHPEHQGRLPALVRAVYRDMLTLHDHLLEVEARHATEEELLQVHTPARMLEVRDAVARAGAAGEPQVLEGETVVSGASWDAALAAAGTAISGVEVVLAGEARNAFCAARPPGKGAGPSAGSGYSVFNNVVVAARHLQQHCGVERVLIIEWGGRRGEGTAELVSGDADIRLLSIHEAVSPSASPRPDRVHSVALPPGTAGELYRSAFEAALADLLADFDPGFILLSAGFDALAADPLGDLALAPEDYYHLTVYLRDQAETVCGGRLVSVLEGGYDPAATGQAVVQHLRALAGLPPLG